jgi:hypothetical protein
MPILIRLVMGDIQVGGRNAARRQHLPTPSTVADK